MKVTYSGEFDLESLQAILDKALKLENNEEMFTSLLEIMKAKKQVLDVAEKLDSLEREAKGLINAKAKALYGNDWQAIAGTGWKIGRSFAGSVYSMIEGEKVDQKFLKIVESLDTKAIDAELEKTEKLPKGLELNDNRTEVIRITIK